MGMYYSNEDRLISMAELAATRLPEPRRPFGTAPALEAAAAGQPTEFTPIGIQKPLTIQVRRIWTGENPQRGWFQPPQSMLVTSAIKGLLTTGGAPRAVNILTGQLQPHTEILIGPAPYPGTPLVCYSPAVIEETYALTIEIGFNTFNQDLFAGLSSVFQQAAGFPLFMPAAPYLLAAGTLTKLAGDLGHLLFNTALVLNHTERLDFGTAGTTPAQAGYYLITPDTPEGRQLSDTCFVDDQGRVLTKSGKNPYRGDVPCAVVSLDGRQQDEKYKQFTPLAATADQLSTFFNIGDNTTKVVSDVVEGLKLVNDLHYRDDADALQKQIDALDKNAPNYQARLTELQNQRKAVIANIQSDLMKPKNAT